MKKIFFLLAIPLLLLSCSEGNVKKTATEYIKNQMKDPSSFKAENVVVLKDTVPIYLSKDLLSAADKAKDALEDSERYKNRSSYLWYDEQQKASRDFSNSYSMLKSLIESTTKEKPVVEYMVLMKVTGNNSFGGTVSSKYIVIVDKDDTSKVLGEFRLDENLIKKIMIINMTENPGSHLKFNQFGKVDTDGMSELEKFIFSE